MQAFKLYNHHFKKWLNLINIRTETLIKMMNSIIAVNRERITKGKIFDSYKALNNIGV
jgi:hypothetical protein